MKKWKQHYLVLFYCAVAISFIAFAYVYMNTNAFFSENVFTEYGNRFLTEGWVDDSGKNIEVPGKYEVEAGTPFVIHCAIGDDSLSGQSLLFRTDHTFVTAKINDQEIYHFGNENEIVFGKTPGSGWQLITLEEVKAGDVLTLSITCPYDKYSGLIREIRLGTKAQMNSYILRHGMGMLIMTIIPFIIGCFIIFIPPFFFKTIEKRRFFNTGLSFLIVSVWSFTEAQCWQLFFKNAYAMQMINFITFSLFLPSVLMALQSMGLLRKTKLYCIMMMVDSLAALVILALQVCNIADFFDLLIVIHLLLVINAFIFITAYIREEHRRNGIYNWITYILYGVIICVTPLDFMDFYVWDYFGNGFFTRIEILFILIASVLLAMKRTFQVYTANIEKRYYEKMAYTDDLTGLRNRRGFDEDVEAMEEQGKKVTILYADMNGLKGINDQQGHHFGDQALQMISNNIRELTGTKTCSYRLGGDEFCVLSEEYTPEELEKACQKINEQLEEKSAAFVNRIGLAYGAVCFDPKEEKSMHQCLLDADKKMYDMKQKMYKDAAYVAERK